MANTMTFEDMSVALAAITAQATGRQAIAAVDSSSFVTQAQTALLTGYDTLSTAISQVLSRTIFSVRPYKRKFGGLEVSNIRYGNHVRKLTPIDKPFEKDQRFDLVEGGSIDQYTVNKPQVIQTNFYGAETYQKHMTIYKDQLDQAFSSASEFGSFLGMMMQNARDMIEQAHENTARAIISNLIGAKCAGDDTNIVHLVTEYNSYIGGGEPLTLTELRSPENYPHFIRWVYARMLNVADLLSERSVKYHLNLTGLDTPQYILRHTPLDRLKMYTLSSEMRNIETEVFAQTFQPEFLKMVDNERVNFWQAIDSPDTINVTPSYIDNKGAVAKGAVQNRSGIFAVMFDEEAAGYTVVNQWAQASPFNAAGGYYNQYWHFTDRYWNDLTENAVVFAMD